MTNGHVRRHLGRRITRKQFLGFSAFGAASALGLFVAIDELERGAVDSHSSTNVPDNSPARGAVSGTRRGIPSSTTFTVDFRVKTRRLDIYSVGAAISTYGGRGGMANINRSPTWMAGLLGLGPTAWRIPLRYNRGRPGSSAQGSQSSGDAATYVRNIKRIGGQPVIVMGGDTSDNDFTAADAARLVHYFNDHGGQNGGPVHAWIIGNEYATPGNDPLGYQSQLAGWAAAMKSADATITLSAPAAPDMAHAGTAIAEAVRNAGRYIDYLSYHSYQGGAKGLEATHDYRLYALQYAREYITAQNFGARVSDVHPALEEYNWAPGEGPHEFFQWQSTVFTASVIGNSLSGGAHAYQYADSNGSLGLMNDGTLHEPSLSGSLFTKFPAYWGIGMWTGLNGTLRRYGDHLVGANSAVTALEVYATDNGKILAINKDTNDHHVTIGLGGSVAGTYAVWQTNAERPLSAPERVTLSEAYSKSVIALTLPAGTVSSIELLGRQ